MQLRSGLWNLARRRVGLLAGASVLAATAGFSACSSGVTGNASPQGFAAAGPEPSATLDATAVPASTGVAAASTVAAGSAAPTTVTTLAPTTVAPATAPPTTVAPTTAPPTTVAPTTTEPSPAIVPVSVPGAPYQAVGRSDGEETARIQWRLLELGFWLSAADGDFGLTTGQAVMAFQKYNGLETSGRVDQATADALGASAFRAHGLADAGTLVEIDKDKQLLFFVQTGVTVWVLNVSTGNGQQYTEPDQNSPGETITGVSLTPNGLHEVNRERAEGWWEGDLGQIYRPKYFVGGVAVHGSNNVPNYPASHGCVRVTTTAMDFIWDTNLMPMGIPVWVHGAH